MSARRRRERRRDPLASTAAVRRIMARVGVALAPGAFSEAELVRILRAASHCERTGWAQSRRGRRPQYPRELLRAAWQALRDALRLEKGSAVTGRTFAEHYLRLLECPHDVLGALEAGRINLFEALQLARIRPDSLGLPSRETERERARVLEAHLTERASARQLNLRVDALLGRTKPGSGEPPKRSENASDPEEIVEDLDAFDEFLADPGALFADQLRQVTAAIAQVDPSTLSEGEVDAILDLLDQLYLRATRAARQGRSQR